MISETLHIAYPGTLGIEDHEYVRDLTESLADAAEKATAIEILGGYYSRDRTFELLKKVPRAKRAACKIRLAVGIDASVKMKQHWADMRLLSGKLRNCGFRDVTVSIVTGRPHFHTKLFHFLRATHHVWFIGSANPGSDRHELMVSFTGKHEALKQYIDAVFIAGTVVTKPFPPRQDPTTLREFFLTGSLIHRTLHQAPFTFDAFRLDPEDREKMMRTLTADVVPHAQPTTQGFGFGLRSAVDPIDIVEDEADEIRRVQLRHYSVDTALGLWAPRSYVDQIREQLLFTQNARSAGLTRFAEQLSGDGAARAREAFAAYIESMERLLLSTGITPRSVDKRDAAFEKFLASRQQMLTSNGGIVRLARRIEIMEMPDIWNDKNAVETFEMSFCTDAAYRLSSGARIIKSIAHGLNLPKQAYVEAGNLRDRLIRRLDKKPWTDAEWIRD